jgi:hypothetical protein
MANEIEIGYVCSKGHYVFKGDEEGCGSKRVAGLFVRQDEDLDFPEEQLKEYVDESQVSILRKIAFWRNG